MTETIFKQEVRRYTKDFVKARRVMNAAFYKRQFFVAKDAADFMAHTLRKMALLQRQTVEEATWRNPTTRR